VLADASGRYQPTEWAKRAIGLYYRFDADRIVAETNFGGQMVEATIRAIDLNVGYRAVQASRGKVARAEPVAALYEQGRVHHVGAFPQLEDQMCALTSAFDRARAGFSPGRVDALVWAITDLVLQPMSNWGIFEFYRRQALGLPIGKSKAAAPTRPVEKSYYAPGSVEWMQQQKAEA
jgi:phage terminase large subunit-like protein